MSKRQNWLGVLLVLILSLGVMAACSSSSTDSTTDTAGTDTPSDTPSQEEVVTEEKAPQPLVIGIEAEPTSLDPHNATDGNSATVQSTMFEGLLDFDEQMNIIPQLATDYYFNDDASEITFALRQGVTFHDGSDFNADVVKANLDYVRNRDNGMARASFFSFIEEIVVNDPHSVTIKAREPNSAMASYLAHSAASFKSLEEINKKIADPNYNLDRSAVGTGPFQFVEWRDGVHVLVHPFDNYWNSDAKPRLESITFKPVVEASTRVNMLKTGEVDLVYPLPTLTADALEADDDIDVFTGPSMDVFYIGINLKHEKYNDARVRQAMNHAVNKDNIIAQVLDGYGTIADSAIAPSVYGYAPQTIYEFDQAKAKSLMSEAGQGDGFRSVLWTRNSTEFIALAEYVAIQLGSIGIDVEVQAYESGTLFDMLDAGEETDLWIGRWSPGTGEADWGLRPNFASDRVPPNYNNSGFYINETVDRLFDEALRSPDPQVSLSRYAQVQEIIYTDAPWVFLHIPDTIVAKRSDVYGVTVRSSGAVNVTKAYKE